MISRRSFIARIGLGLASCALARAMAFSMSAPQVVRRADASLTFMGWLNAQERENVIGILGVSRGEAFLKARARRGSVNWDWFLQFPIGKPVRVEKLASLSDRRCTMSYLADGPKP